MDIINSEIFLQRGTTGNLNIEIEMDELGTLYERTEGDGLIFEIKKRPDPDIEAIISIEVSGLYLIIRPEDTIDLPSGDYFYEIKLTTNNGDVYKSHFMPFHLTNTVTR